MNVEGCRRRGFADTAFAIFNRTNPMATDMSPNRISIRLNIGGRSATERARELALETYKVLHLYSHLAAISGCFIALMPSRCLRKILRRRARRLLPSAAPTRPPCLVG